MVGIFRDTTRQGYGERVKGAFAGIVMIVGGGFKILEGLGWVLNSDRFPGDDAILGQGARTWGWWTILVGLVVLLAGFAVFNGNVLARTVGVILAVVSAMTAFATFGFHPFGALIIIFVDIAIIWALTVHGRDAEKARMMAEGV